MTLLNSIKNELKIVKCKLVGRFKKVRELPVEEPVDFVVTWVDDTDEEWLRQKNKYQNPDLEGNGMERYRDWGLFKYWFRAVEKYAPWVRKIHVVTCGHYPEWLNLEHEKINLVKHEDFIPPNCLPTFNANTIELHIHRIKELSEQYVYFNDDVYINRAVKKENFFSGKYPKHSCEPAPYKHYIRNELFDHIIFNNIGLINDYFDVTKSIINHPELWFNKSNKKMQKYCRLSAKDNYLYGMNFPHLGVPRRKTTGGKVWDNYGEELDKTCRRKFRTASDFNQLLFLVWDIISGEFSPVEHNYYGKFFENMDVQLEEIEKTIAEENEMMICLNDSSVISEANFQILKNRIDKAFRKKYPNKSEFEI